MIKPLHNSAASLSLAEATLLLLFFFCFAFLGSQGAVAVGWRRGLGTVLTEMSLPLAIEALAFIYKVGPFFSSHATGASTTQRRIHGIVVTISMFTVESLTPLVQILLFR